MLYLMCYDDNPKRSIEAKIADAIGAYERRFQARPTVALVSELDNAPALVCGVPVRSERRVQRNNVQVGVEA